MSCPVYGLKYMYSTMCYTLPVCSEETAFLDSCYFHQSTKEREREREDGLFHIADDS